MEIWQQILLMIFTPTAAVAVFAYILQKLFDRTLSRDLERFKAELDLQQFEYQTKYSYIHQQRAEVIGEFYKLLHRAIKEVGQLVRVFRFADGESLQSKKQRAANRFNEAQDYFFEHRLYFDSKLCDKIESLLKLMTESLMDFDIAQPGEEIEHGPANDPQMWIAAHKKMAEQVAPIKSQLEEQFRMLLEARKEA
jgi:hypothetical protein